MYDRDLIALRALTGVNFFRLSGLVFLLWAWMLPTSLAAENLCKVNPNDRQSIVNGLIAATVDAGDDDLFCYIQAGQWLGRNLEFVATFHALRSLSAKKSFQFSSDYYLLRRKFFAQSLWAVKEGKDVRRVSAYITNFYEFVEPFDSLQFRGADESLAPPVMPMELSNVLRCFVDNDDLSLTAGEVMESTAYDECIGRQ